MAAQHRRARPAPRWRASRRRARAGRHRPSAPPPIRRSSAVSASRKPNAYGEASPPAIHSALANSTGTGLRARCATSVLEAWCSAGRTRGRRARRRGGGGEHGGVTEGERRPRRASAAAAGRARRGRAATPEEGPAPLAGRRRGRLPAPLRCAGTASGSPRCPAARGYVGDAAHRGTARGEGRRRRGRRVGSPLSRSTLRRSFRPAPPFASHPPLSMTGATAGPHSQQAPDSHRGRTGPGGSGSRSQRSGRARVPELAAADDRVGSSPYDRAAP